MMLRRLTGVLTAACMFHLSVVASDAACATHMMGGDMMMDGEMTMDGASMPPGATDLSTTPADHASTSAARSGHQCDTPVQSDCCTALASCTTTFAVSTSRSAGPVVEHGAIARSVFDIPRSESVAPATPPPKA